MFLQVLFFQFIFSVFVKFYNLIFFSIFYISFIFFKFSLQIFSIFLSFFFFKLYHFKLLFLVYLYRVYFYKCLFLNWAFQIAEYRSFCSDRERPFLWSEKQWRLSIDLVDISKSIFIGQERVFGLDQEWWEHDVWNTIWKYKMWKNRNIK